MRLNTFGSRVVWLLVFGLMPFTAKAVMAHHSFEAEYDANKPATVSGVVTKLDWVNPHAFVTLEFKDPSGKVKTFKIEMGPPYSLVRNGWKKDMLKIGDKVTVEGCALAKDGSDSAGSEQTTRMVLANGQKLAMR